MNNKTKKLITTIAISTLLSINVLLYASNPNEPKLTKIAGRPQKISSDKSVLVSLDSNFGYRKHNLMPSLYQDAKYKMATNFGLGGHHDFIFNEGANNEKNYLEAGVVVDIKYGPGLRGNDDKKFLNKEAPKMGFEGFDGFAGIHTTGSTASTTTVPGWKIQDDNLALQNAYSSGNAANKSGITATDVQGEATLPTLQIDKNDLAGLKLENTDPGTYTYYDDSGTLQTNQALPSSPKSNFVLIKGTDQYANTGLELKGTASSNPDVIDAHITINDKANRRVHSKINIADVLPGTAYISTARMVKDAINIRAFSVKVPDDSWNTIIPSYKDRSGNKIKQSTIFNGYHDESPNYANITILPDAEIVTGGDYNTENTRSNIFFRTQDFKVDIPDTVADISKLQTALPGGKTNLNVGIADLTTPTTAAPTALSNTNANNKIPVTGLTLVPDHAVLANGGTATNIKVPAIPAIAVPEIPAIPKMDPEKRDLSTFDLSLSQAFFYIRKGERVNPYIFEFGKVADVAETFNIGFNNIMPGADDYRFTVHANIDTKMTESAPGWQVGADATFATLTGRIKGARREPLWFKTYAALYNESNYRYAPRVNFISPELAGFRFSASFTPDGGDGAVFQPLSTNRISKSLTNQGIFAGDYENIWSGAANYTYEGSQFTTSISLVGEYAHHEKSCISAGKCTQNYYDLRTYSLSGMLSWDNFSFFGAWGDLGKSGQRRNLGQLTDGSGGTVNHYISSFTPITEEGTLKTYNTVTGVVKSGTESGLNSGGNIEPYGTTLTAAPPPANTLDANDRVASNTIDVHYDKAHENKGSVIAAQGGYAVIKRKKYETNYWTLGASYKIDNASFGASYFRSNAGQYDIYGGTGKLNRFTIITTYKIARGMAPYFEITWFNVTDESTAIEKSLIDSVGYTPSTSTSGSVAQADYNNLVQLANGGSGGAAPSNKKVKYVNQVGLFKEPLKGNQGVIMITGIRFRF